MKKRAQLLSIIFFLFFTANLSLQAKKIDIVATTGMISDLVINIAKEKAEVKSLMGTGVDPHLYKASYQDLKSLENADIIFYNGLHLEGKMQDIFHKLARKKPVFAVSKNIDENKLIKVDSSLDPHIWFDVSLWIEACKEILRKLEEFDPKNKEYYKKNAKIYLEELKDLDIWVKNEIQKIPEKSRILITAHDAFGYFAKAYGIEVRALQGISTASEFGLSDIKKLKQIILNRKIKAVFVESSVPKKFLESLVQGIQAQGEELSIGGELFSDAMGLKGTKEGTYIGMVKHNVNIIVSSLK